MTKLIEVAKWASLIGFILSLYSHIEALFGLTFIESKGFLHVGIFMVIGPVLVYAARQEDSEKPSVNDLTKSPSKIIEAFFTVLFLYAGLNFFDLFGLSEGLPKDADDLRIFSGHWMLFYFVGYVMNGNYLKCLKVDSDKNE